jgi:nitric oxide reductase subunit C
LFEIVAWKPHLCRAALGLAVFVLAACSAPATPAGPPTLDPDSSAGRGAALFTGTTAKCSTCHSLSPDTVIVGPSLAGIAARAGGRVPGLGAEEYLYQSILDPDAFKAPGFENLAMDPTLGKTLTVEQLDDIVAYLLTLE